MGEGGGGKGEGADETGSMARGDLHNYVQKTNASSISLTGAVSLYLRQEHGGGGVQQLRFRVFQFCCPFAFELQSRLAPIHVGGAISCRGVVTREPPQKHSLPLVAGTDPQIVNPGTDDFGRKPYNLPLQEMLGLHARVYICVCIDVCTDAFQVGNLTLNTDSVFWRRSSARASSTVCDSFFPLFAAERREAFSESERSNACRYGYARSNVTS